MFVVTTITEALLYVCYSLLLGSFILYLVPEASRPEIKIPKAVLLTAALGIAFLSFIPLLKIILEFYQDLGLGLTLKSVLTNFQVGKSWISTGVLSALLFLYLIPVKLERKPIFALPGIILTLGLIAALGWSSHASSLSRWPGFFTHTVHVLAVSTWIGILVVVSWFSRKPYNWRSFLGWFSPLALICMSIVILSGIGLMTFVMNLRDYANAWALSYGQTLLLKHLTIIPLLAFAFINSVLIRRKLKNEPDYNPIPWTKLESVIGLLIFSITATLSQEAPPHNIKNTLKEDGSSKLFSLFHQNGTVYPLHFSPGIASFSLFAIAILVIGLLILTYSKKAPKLIALILSILFIIAGYLAFMFSL